MKIDQKSVPWIVLGVLAAAVIAYMAYTSGQQNQPGAPGQEQHACTLEAKLCADGSYVGRVGPNCEFASCPGPTPTR